MFPVLQPWYVEVRMLSNVPLHRLSKSEHLLLVPLDQNLVLVIVPLSFRIHCYTDWNRSARAFRRAFSDRFWDKDSR